MEIIQTEGTIELIYVMQNSNTFKYFFHICTLMFNYDASLSCHVFIPLQLCLGLNVRFYEIFYFPQVLKLSIFALWQMPRLGFYARIWLYFLWNLKIAS